jgi:hypothetical protein
VNRKTLGALIALNVVLLAGLAAVCLSPKPAQAQGFAGSSYLMLAGDVVGREQQAAIYVIDVNTGQIATLFFNGSTGKWEEIAYKNVADDLAGK